MWRQVTDFITESLIKLIRLNVWLIQERSKSQCAHYLLQIVLNITNITFRMDSIHIGTQAVTVFMNESLNRLIRFV